MRVIPVIDLMGGLVVRGVGGRRSEYRPIQSLLVSDPHPRSVGRALAAAGFLEIYLADLDAILGRASAWSVYRDLMDCGLSLVVDAGLDSLDRGRELANFKHEGQKLSAIVAGLESLDHPRDLAALCRLVEQERLVFSLDLKGGSPLSGPGWADLHARQIATIALRCGVRRVIVLDLAAVGMGQGVGTQRLCRELRCLEATLEITAGGGVRSLADLRGLRAAGCDRALVASALHDGRLVARDCARMR